MKKFLFLILFFITFLNINAQQTSSYYGTRYNFWYIGTGRFPTVPLDTTYIDSMYEYNGLPMTWDSSGVKYGGTTFGKLVPTKVLRLNEISSPTFISGWTGSGFRLDQGVADTGVSTIEVDNAIIRGSMTVNELIRNQIRGENGNMYYSSVGKIDSVSNDSIWFEDPDNDDLCAFYTNDLIRVQRWDPLGNSIHVGAGKVVSVTGRMIKVLIYNGTFNENNVVVRFGNTTNTARQGSIYIASIGSNTPYMDIVDGVDTVLAWGSYLKTKARFGDLGGVVSAKYGALYGYGLWARDNIWLENGFIALSDSGHIRAGKASYTDNTAGFYLGNDSGTPRFSIGNATDYLKWDGTNLSIAGSISIQNPSAINTSDLNNDAGWTDDTAADAAQADADAAYTLAGSKIQTFYQASPPSTSAPEGSIWFETDQLNTIYRLESGAWNEKVGVGSGFGTYIDASGIYTGTVAAANVVAGSFAGKTFTGGSFVGTVLQTEADGSSRVRLSGNNVAFVDDGDVTHGTIYASETDGSTLATGIWGFLSNVSITGNLSVGGSYGLSSGDIPDLSGTYALSSHNHAASNITSGTFDIARIPTGTTSSTVSLGNHLHTGVYAPVSHNQAWSTITSTPTTISGYGITDAALGTDSGTPLWSIALTDGDLKFFGRAITLPGTGTTAYAIYSITLTP